MLRKGSKPLTETHPDLCEEWSEENKFGPEEFSTGSHFRAKWVCGACGCKWVAYIFNRTIHKSGCPLCGAERTAQFSIISRISKSGSLLDNFPELCKEWHPTKNKKGPECYTSASDKCVWWKSNICEHEWKAIIKNRSMHGNGCPVCAEEKRVLSRISNRIYSEGSLLEGFPELCKEWHKTKNKKGPKYYTKFSHSEVWWVCEKGHEWRARISSRTFQGNSCPHCHYYRVSKVSQKWLDSLNINKREVRIDMGNRYYFVDGFDPETNTIYEFLGDYWHGNPKKFPPKKQHPVVGKTFGELYKETMEKIQDLESAGYKVVYIWENDFLK